MRTVLLLLLLIATMAAYHFWRVTEIQDGQIILLRENVSLSIAHAKAQQNIAWMMAEGTRTCAKDLVEVPEWLGLLTKKPVIAVVGKNNSGIGGGP